MLCGKCSEAANKSEHCEESRRQNFGEFSLLFELKAHEEGQGLFLEASQGKTEFINVFILALLS